MRQVNLLPEELQKAEKVMFIRNSLLVLLGPALGVLVIINLMLGLNIGKLKKTAEQPLAFQETAETSDLKKRIEAQQQDLQEYGGQNKQIIKTFVKYFSSSYLLKIIGRLSTDKVWLKAIELDTEGGICRLDGKSFNTRLVSEFMLELKRLPHFHNVELISVGKESGQTAQEVDFQIVCYLK